MAGGRPPKGTVRHLFKTCAACGKEFKTPFALADKKYCSLDCYRPLMVASTRRPASDYVEQAKRMTGSGNGNWKGGWSIERQREKHRDWCRRNRDRVAARGARRRARKRAAPGSFTADEWLAIKRDYAFKCVGCGRPETLIEPLTVDHKVPLSRGGTNYADNIQPMCLQCNSSKGNRDGWKARKKRNSYASSHASPR